MRNAGSLGRAREGHEGTLAGPERVMGRVVVPRDAEVFCQVGVHHSNFDSTIMMALRIRTRIWLTVSSSGLLPCSLSRDFDQLIHSTHLLVEVTFYVLRLVSNS